ncbi:MAG: hypothetical protein GY792_21855 [Gammaproteobacteria bacterium]|nr:hypothetical protein [Gammaproteobacteria bacterium]
MIYIGFQSIEQFGLEMDVTKKEIVGLQLVTATQRLSTKSSTSRGVHAVFLNGGKNYQERSQQAEKEVSQAFADFVELNQKLHDPFELSQLIAA